MSENLEELVKIYTHPELSKLLGLNPQTLRSKLQKLGLKALNGRIKPQRAHTTRDEVAKLVEIMSMAEIARHLGLDQETVSYHIKKLGVKPKQGKPGPHLDVRILELFNAGLSRENIAKELGVSKAFVSGRIRLHQGLSRSEALDAFLDPVMVGQQCRVKTVGQIAEELRVSKSALERFLHKHDIKAGYQKTYSSEASDRAKVRRHGKNFTRSVKKLRFLEENGVCQWCSLPIEGGWESATYHHKIMVCKGGNGDASNCMVLHASCHGGRGCPLNPELHDGLSFSKQPLPRCVWCGLCKKLDSLHLCINCRKPSKKMCLCGRVIKTSYSGAVCYKCYWEARKISLRREIFSLKDQGLSLTKIAQQLNLDTAYVCLVFKGIPRKRVK